MNPADWVILVFVALMALQGYARGFLVGVASLAGFVVGGLLGSRIAPLLLSQGSRSPYAPLIALGGALLAGTILGRLFEGVARRMRRLVWFPPFRLVDGIAGAALNRMPRGLGVAWIADARRVARRQRVPAATVASQRSGRLSDPQGTQSGAATLRADSRLAGSRRSVPERQRRVAAVPAPDPAIVRAAGVRSAVARW